MTTTLTHPERVIDPDSKTTKLQLYEFCEAVTDWLYPHLQNRLVTLVRCPDGLAKSCFYQKHLLKGKYKGLKGAMVDTDDGEEEFMVVKAPVAILEAVQMGALEFHPWGSLEKTREKPDRLIFDLDPAPEIPLSQLREATQIVREGLESLELVPFLKATGGKGLHAVVPIKPEFEWDDVKAICRTLVEQWAKEHPKLFLTKMTKASRKGKIYLDYLRNAKGATAIAPYSPRARANVPVAMPLEWNDLEDLKSPAQFTIGNALQWIEQRKRDPWEDLAASAKSLKRVLKT